MTDDTDSRPADDASRQWRLARRPEGRPGTDDFDLVETDVPDPGPGEALVRTVYLSVDPYMRGRMRDRASYAEPWDVGQPMEGHAVGEVVASRHADLAAGDHVRGRLRWADYAVADGDDLERLDPEGIPLSAHLGVAGMPGRTAYFGMLDVAAPRPGDTVVVSGAAGAVGSAAGQLAAMSGATVVGVAGSDRKVRTLEEEFGFDAAVNYAAADDYGAMFDGVLDGVDVYFDNVGGPITDAVFDRLNVDARVAVCGQIALYNAETVPTGPRKLGTLVGTRARVEGFLVSDYAERAEEATARLREWVADGDLTYRETVVEGLERAPEAFLGLFEGENVGKMLVQVGPE